MTFRNQITKKIVFPVGDLIMNTNIIHCLSKISAMNNWSSKQIVDWQAYKLHELINHAYYNTRFYNNLFNSRNLSPKDFTTIDDLQKLPVITKEIIRNNYQDLIPYNIKKISFHKASTGGSSGNPLKYLLDNLSWSYTTAFNIYYWSRIGYNLGDKYVALGSSSLFPTNTISIKHSIYYWLKGKIPLSAMNLSENTIVEYLRFIRKKKAKFIFGYASAVYLLAKKAIEIGIDLPNIHGIITTSEILTNEYRNTISTAFNQPIIDAYGVSDGGIDAFRTNDNFFSISYNCIIEIEGEKNNNSTSGEVITTDLFNYAMPIIRYKVGDNATLLDRNSNNYNGQTFLEILGRSPDIIKLSNGHVLTGAGFTILFKDLNVLAYRIRQIGDLEILCEIHRGKNYSIDEEKLIMATFKKHAGKESKISIKHVDGFCLSQSGKCNFFIST